MRSNEKEDRLDAGRFALQIEHARHRAELLRASSREDAPTSGWERAALAELQTCVEELNVAQEEMREQAAELLALNASVERERQRYRALFTDAPHGYVMTDERGVITEANRAAAELFRMPADGLPGKPLALFVSLHERERFQRWVRELTEAGDGAPAAGDGTFAFHTCDRARAFPCHVRPLVMPAGPGGEREVRWAVQDVSDRERARAADRLQEEGRRKDEFLAVLGHELRNPLAAIALAADVLPGEPGDAAAARAAEIVRRNAEQLRRLVDDLLDVSRVAHGRITLQPCRLDLHEVVCAAAEAARPLITGRGHQFAIAACDRPVWVHGDGARLHQVVANLLDNAAKYTPPGGEVSIDLRVDGGAAVLAIKDSGVGIPRHMLERVFELFEQVDGTSDRSERGLGLGLALVRDLVALHGGTVRAHSDGVGRGSLFVVQLPLADGSAASEGRDEVAEQARAAPEAILVVDDNLDAADLIAMALRRRGHEVGVAHTGDEALALAAAGRFSVALVDLGLPDIDGFEVARRLRQRLPGVMLVAVTGYGDEHSRGRAAEAGFEHYLLKPVRPDRVVRLLERAAPSDR